MSMETILDTEDEDSIFQMGFSPDPAMIENLVGLTRTRNTDQRLIPSLANIEAGTLDSLSALVGLDLSSIAGSPQGHAFQVSENGRVENSGNINFHFNSYFQANGDSANMSPQLPRIETIHRSISPDSSSPPPQASPWNVESLDESPTGLIVSPEAFSQREEQPYDSSLLFMEKEDGCYIEPVMPSQGNIPFYPGTPPEIRSYMLSKFNMFQADSMVPLWKPKPRPRQFHVGMTDMNLVGDVGYFDKEGGFRSLFNIFLTEQENRQYGYTPPPNFKEYTSRQVKKDIVICRNFRPTALIGSKYSLRFSVSGRFRRRIPTVEPSILSLCTKAEVQDPSYGSVAVCYNSIRHQLDESKHPAQREYMQPYLNRHAIGWYRHYNSIKRPQIKNGALVLVNMSWSTDSWATAVFSREPDGDAGTYYANLLPFHSQHPNVYAWDAHESINSRTSNACEEGKPHVSDYCIGVGVSSIFMGNPPGRLKSKVKSGMSTMSRSFSAMSLVSVASSIRSKISFRK